jgi:PAS domain S-box-containing protein
LPIEAVLDGHSDASQGLRDAIFSKVFNLVPETLTITRIADGRFVEVNRNWEAMTGFTYEEAIGRTSNELGVWVVPEQRDRIIQSIRRDGEVRDVDVTFLHKQGHLYYNKVSASVFDVAGEKYMMLAVQDVSAQRAAQQQILELNQQLEARVRQRTLSLEQANVELADALGTLERAKDELVRSEKMAALGSLVAGVAHELNTPIGNSLTVATTFEHRVTELAQAVEQGLRRSTLDQFVADARLGAEVLVRNLTRAGELVRSFKQVAVDQASAQRRRFVLLEVVSEILVTLNPAIRKSGCAVRVNIDRALEMDSYPGPLGQVFSNLIVNAMTHGFAEGSAGTLQIAARALDSQEVEILVSDDGAGIDAENIKRVFDPFFTTRLGQGGSGLGLHIVLNIVTSVMGGKVDVSSHPGQGATFSLRLPMRPPEEGQAA